MRNEVTAWAPATVANLNVGFDGLGCALKSPGETIIARRTDAHTEVRIASVFGPGNLSLEISRNVAGLAASSLHRALATGIGVDLEIHKEIAPGSGIGSSAASAAAAVVAIDGLFETGLRPDELLPFALDGEALASGARHADNVAPALMGGLVLCPPEGRPMAVPVPADWPMLIIHPQVEIRTADARGVLPSEVPFRDAIDQARWFATFVAACGSGDADAALFALEDLLVTKHRARLLPGFDAIRAAAFEAGARAGGIAGSGPSTFWVGAEGSDLSGLALRAQNICEELEIDVVIHHTGIAKLGAHILP
jgi:homoserine kinase